MDSFNVPLSHLVLSPKLNSRTVYDQKALEALAEDMKRHGVLAPPVVRAMSPDGAPKVDGVQSFRYEVVAGTRRVKAAELAGLDSIPVVLRNLTDEQAISVAVHENHDREDFHFLDRAEAWRRWKEAGATPEQIAEELKVSRSTVFTVIALCGLTPEVKKACWEPDPEKRFTESVARELATVPPKLQGQALKACLGPGPDGKKRTARECIDLIRTEFRLDLKKAGFDPEDAGLKAEACGGAAACTTCPFRTGNSPELFEQATSPNQCTNPPGFRARQDAQWARQVDDGEHNRGPRCLPDAKAKDLFIGGGLRDDVPYVRAIDPCHQDKSQRSYKALLGPAADKHLVLARTPTRDVLQLVPTANLNKVLDEVGVIKRRLSEVGKVAAPAADGEAQQSAEEKKAEKEKTVRRDAVTRLVVADVMAKLEKRGPDKRLWRLVADTMVNSGLERIWERRGVDESPSKYLDRLNEPQLANFVIEAVLEIVLYPAGPKYTETLLAFAKLFGVEVKDHEKTIAAAERAEPSVKKADVAAAEKPKADASKPAPKPKKAAKS